jgi:hypothetical protein
MSEALLYELLSNPRDRRPCFSKLPSVDNPVDLVMHVGGYLLKEVNTRCPSPKPSERTHRLRFQFNPLLLTNSYQLPPEAADEIARQLTVLRSDVAALKERALGIPDHFPGAFSGNRKPSKAEVREAEELIALPGSLLEFYGQLRPQRDSSGFHQRSSSLTTGRSTAGYRFNSSSLASLREHLLLTRRSSNVGSASFPLAA